MGCKSLPERKINNNMKKYLDVDTRLPGEKRESKLARWIKDTKLAMNIQIQMWKMFYYWKK
jgi:DNA-binding transcriptional regulator GbsR (MarR family)